MFQPPGDSSYPQPELPVGYHVTQATYTLHERRLYVSYPPPISHVTTIPLSLSKHLSDWVGGWNSRIGENPPPPARHFPDPRCVRHFLLPDLPVPPRPKAVRARETVHPFLPLDRMFLQSVGRYVLGRHRLRKLAAGRQMDVHGVLFGV